MVVFKIEHFIGVNAAVAELADNFHRHGAEIFTDHHALMTLAFQRQDRQQIVNRILHVRPVIRRFTVRDPPQAQHGHHVVNTQRAAVLHVGAQQVDKRLVRARRHHVWIHRRQAPILAERAQDIRRRTDGRLQAVEFTVAPGFRAALGHADGQVAIQADRHLIALAHLPAGGKLAVRQPLQPQVEVHFIRVFFTERFHFRRVDGLIRFRPDRPAPAHFVLFHLIRVQRIKCRLPVQALALLRDKLAERGHLLVIALRKAFPRQAQRGHFQRRDGRIVHPVRVARLLQRLLRGAEVPPGLCLFAVCEVV
ncbi:Uncharacterised protein [Enterobacter cloacae]|nr:Uncharacterised protein [Enterobacter cloacae]